MANLGAFEFGKSYKQMMQDFHEMRIQAFVKNNKSDEIVASLEKIKKLLLDKLEDQKKQSQIEIEKAEIKKRNLISRLVILEKIHDDAAQDDIIKELEEYSRIRRYRDAQLARINKEIQDINLTENQFQEKTKQ